MLMVQKYGGSSLADPERIRRAAARAAALADQGNAVIVVVSAQGDTTDDMIARSRAISARCTLREMDAFLAAGEQMSAGLMTMALQGLGQPAVSLTGWQAGIHTDGTFGNARIARVDPQRIAKELARGRIVVVAGFQGITADGDISTLGRGGSDTTAVALAAALHADRCQIFTDVDGVYDRDPRKCPDAIRYDRISYENMLHLARNGAQVLHDRCIELAQLHGIAVEVLSAEIGSGGTVVGGGYA